MTSANQDPMDMTVRQAFEIYQDRRRRSGAYSPVTIGDSEYTMTKYAAGLWDRPVASITPQECAQLFSELTKIGPVAANRTLCCLRTVFDVARDCTIDMEGHSVLLDKGNPVTLMLKSTPFNPVGRRNGRIPIGRVRAVWRALKELGEHAANPATRTAADWLRLRLLTGMRPSESQALRFSHVHLVHNIIEVPPALTKNYRSLILPMPLQLSDLIEHRRAVYVAEHAGQDVPPEAFIFGSAASRAGHIMNARRALKAVAGPETTQYDLRRTFWDVAAQCGIDPDVRIRLLNLAARDYGFGRLRISRGMLLDALTRIAQWLDQDEGPAASLRGLTVLH
ncbi:Phage integrase family protein [Variovorax sp. HW608]|uniref:tyrosine-type recombinase/integrase n=1 Tax=Variovorax sp. HW608 TaxID=1034889 RepID=UPI00081F8D39|nr:tyrosine-type recombinase/integrase [Variovorax sp. HW608]SCK54717.1 Phage integrase family protein [Variovorax sp. HW608]